MLQKLKNLLLVILVLATGCKKVDYQFKYKGTCTDGILNQDETGIDCGGTCGNTCADAGLAHTRKYYVSFLYHGNPVVIQSDTDFLSANPFQSVEAEGNVASSLGLSGPHGLFAIRLPANGKSTDDFFNLQHDTVYFESVQNDGKVAHFTFVDSAGNYGATENVPGLGEITGNMIIIDDVFFDNGKTPYDTYKLLLTGRFSAKVSSNSSGAIHTITKGTFGVAFSSND